MFLEVKGINKRYGAEQVLADCSFSLGEQKLMCILGQSGSGKTTLLKILAGLEKPDSGNVYFRGEVIDMVPPNDRNFVYLYQEPLLFPHLSVFENVAFGLQIRNIGKTEMTDRVSGILEKLGLSGQGKKMPGQLSGGQRQRVAFGRAVAVNPPVLLLDEPFGALDVANRGRMQDFLLNVIKDFPITTLFVTHDLKEALRMGGEIALIRDGKLKKYTDRNAFIEDEQTGVRGEIDFWKNLEVLGPNGKKDRL